MQPNTAKKLLPIISDDKRVEVSIADDQAYIKLSTWVEDLGWCGQKTLQIDVEMLDDLHRAIASARYQVNNQKSDVGAASESPNIITFPIIS
jgi:hypothetical protein